MKRILGIGTSALLLLFLGYAASLYANQGRHDREDRGPKQEKHGKAEKERHDKGNHGKRMEAHERHEYWSEHRARNWHEEHRGWKERGGYHGYRVPEAGYRVYFGPSHRFRLHTLRVVVVGGHRRFHYHGYWFSVVDPWPEYWAPNWYDDDDVYLAYYGDGYYLCNRRYPRDRIAVSLYLNLD